MDIVCEDGTFLYSADSYADELPYWIDGAKHPQLIVPYTLDANDMRFVTAQGFNSGDQFFRYLKDSFDILYAEGSSAPKMLSVGLHCRLVGRPGRAAALERFLDYVQSHSDVWIARRIDIARHWVRTHPPKEGYRPSRMSRALFAEIFSDLDDCCPGVVDKTFERGLTVTEDTSDGLSDAFARSIVQLTAGSPDRDNTEYIKRAICVAHKQVQNFWRSQSIGGATS